MQGTRQTWIASPALSLTRDVILALSLSGSISLSVKWRNVRIKNVVYVELPNTDPGGLYVLCKYSCGLHFSFVAQCYIETS